MERKNKKKKHEKEKKEEDAQGWRELTWNPQKDLRNATKRF